MAFRGGDGLERIAVLEEENRALKEENAELRDANTKLRAQLRGDKDEIIQQLVEERDELLARLDGNRPPADEEPYVGEVEGAVKDFIKRKNPLGF